VSWLCLWTKLLTGDVIKILFHHTGALIGNKLTKHRKRRIQHPLRQISNYVSFTSVDELAVRPSAGISLSVPRNIPKIEVTAPSPNRSRLATVSSADNDAEASRSTLLASSGPINGITNGTSKDSSSGTTNGEAEQINHGPMIRGPVDIVKEDGASIGSGSPLTHETEPNSESPLSKLKRLASRLHDDESTAASKESDSEREERESPDSHPHQGPRRMPSARGFLRKLRS
jgi:hypothetical protein